MGQEGVSNEMGELPMGRCSPLVGLRSSSQSLDQLELMFREFWKISWRFQGGQHEFDVICREEAAC